jgi:hypothetical protein
MSKRTGCVGCDEEVRVGGSVQLSIFLHFDRYFPLICYVMHAHYMSSILALAVDVPQEIG